VEAVTGLVTLTLPQFAAVVVLFLPGFVSLKVHTFLRPGSRSAAAELLIDAIGYSLLNAGAFSWAIFAVSTQLERAKPNYWLVACLSFLVCLVGPVIWPLLMRLIQRYGFRGGWLLGEQKSAFDAYFSTNDPCWIIVHLRDGSQIAGYFGGGSFASAHPHSEDFYLQELWSLDSVGRFERPIPNSKGALFHRSDYIWLEFFWDTPNEQG
jgi:hypothetical protein